MKILYIVHQFFPEYHTGTEKVVLNLATMMQKSGHMVKVLAYSFYNDSFYDKIVGNIMFKEFTYNGIPVMVFKHQNIPTDLNYSLENRDLANIADNIIANEKPDIIHLVHPMRVCEFVRTFKSLKIPYIVTLTDYFLICPKYILSTSKGGLCTGPDNGNVCHALCTDLDNNMIIRRLSITKDILLNAKKITAPSRYIVSIFKKEFKDIGVKIINHGISYSTIKKNKRIYRKDDKLVFCYIGTISRHKGIHVLLKAFKDIKSDGIYLKIYGSGLDKYVNKLKDMVNEDKRIEFCGNFSGNSGDIFSNVDVAIVPSIWPETYSLVLHEAIACNVPVIASDIGAMTEKIKDGSNGWTFRVGDPNHLKEILEMIIDNPIILNSLKKGVKNYMVPTIEQETYIYEREYKRIIRSI